MNNLSLYIISVLIWGSTWFAIEFQLGVVVPEVSIVYRYVIAATALILWCRIRQLPLRFELRDHAWFALLGILLFWLNYVFAYRAQIHITSALTALAFSMMVWMNILNARLFFGIRAGPRVLAGAAMGIAGIFILFAPQIGEVALTDDTFVGLVLAMSGAFVASLGNIASQAAQKRQLPVVQSNAWGMFYGATLSGLYALIAGLPFEFELTASYVISLGYLAIFGSVIAFGAYLTLIGRIGAHRAGYAAIMFPVVALILSMLFEGLEIDAAIVTGALLVLTGNAIVLGAPPGKTEQIS